MRKLGKEVIPNEEDRAWWIYELPTPGCIVYVPALSEEMAREKLRAEQHKGAPVDAYVHFDGDDHEYPVMLHSELHVVPIDRPSVLREVGEELERARRKFPGKQNSPHEGWAVLQEEVDELWDDVKGNAPRAQMRKEAIQVAAMAVRFIEDLCDAPTPCMSAVSQEKK